MDIPPLWDTVITGAFYFTPINHVHPTFFEEYRSVCSIFVLPGHVRMSVNMLWQYANTDTRATIVLFLTQSNKLLL